MLFRKGKKSEPSEEMTKALLSVLDGNYKEAERVLESLVRVDTSRVGPMLALGRLYRLRGEVGRAIRVHQNLLLRTDLSKSERFGALKGLAGDFRAGGFLKRAIRAYEDLLEENTKDFLVINVLVELYGQVQDYGRSISMLKRLRDSGNKSKEARLYLAYAELQVKRGEERKAYRSLRRCLRKDSNLAVAWEKLGDLEEKQGRHRRAQKAWLRGIDCNSSQSRSIYPKLKKSYLSQNALEHYEIFLKERVQSDSLDFDARIALCTSQEERGDLENALKGLETLLGYQKFHLEALVLRTRWLIRSGADEELIRSAFEATCDGIGDLGAFRELSFPR